MSTQVSLEIDRRDELLAGVSGYIDSRASAQSFNYSTRESTSRETRDLVSTATTSPDRTDISIALNEDVPHLQRDLAIAPNHTNNGPDTPLFTNYINHVDFNNVSAGNYKDGTQYDALAGDDVVFLGDNLQEQIEAGLSLSDHWFEGGMGNDEIHGGSSIEHISGGFGNDIISGGDGDDSLQGANGDDTLMGDGGNDTIFCDTDMALPPLATPPSGNSPYGNDKAEGGEGDDQIYGCGGSDTLFGNAGDDELYGDTHIANYVFLYDQKSTDHNYLDGGEGDDFLVGGGGDDVMIGGEGNDCLMTASFDPQENTLLPSWGADQMYGGEGADLFYFHVVTASDTLEAADVICDFEDGKDIIAIIMKDGTEADFIVKDEGNDCVIYLAETQQVIVKILNAAGQISGDDFNVV